MCSMLAPHWGEPFLIIYRRQQIHSLANKKKPVTQNCTLDESNRQTSMNNTQVCFESACSCTVFQWRAAVTRDSNTSERRKAWPQTTYQKMFLSLCLGLPSQLLDCFIIPVVLLLSWFFLLVRYKTVHFVGTGLCLLGVGCMVGADVLVGRQPGLGEYLDLAYVLYVCVNTCWSSRCRYIWKHLCLLLSLICPGEQKLFGDLLVLGGATLYGISNVCEEFIVKNLSRVEFLGMMGLFGSFFSGIQLWVCVVGWDMLRHVKCTTRAWAFGNLTPSLEHVKSKLRLLIHQVT